MDGLEAGFRSGMLTIWIILFVSLLVLGNVRETYWWALASGLAIGTVIGLAWRLRYRWKLKSTANPKRRRW
jgi:Na+-driven multidrug efflux pump